MTSTFTWLDSSERERRRMLDVVSGFAEQDTRDELGLAPIRDSLADQFFPGVIVLQTRARYALFVPWMYRRLEDDGFGSADIAERARKFEGRLIVALTRLSEETGVIGRQAGVAIRRLPSEIYWPALVAWRICLFEGTQWAYHDALDQIHERRHQAIHTDEGEAVGTGVVTWHPGLRDVAAPRGFPNEADFQLTREEAVFLSGRIDSAVPESLLAFLVRAGRPRAVFGDFPWAHPQVGELPQRLATLVEHARAFAEVMHGSALLYNLMLAEQAHHEERTERYRELWLAWADEMESRRAALARWDRAEFWPLVDGHGHRILAPVREFVESWAGWVASKDFRPRDPGDRDAQRLVRDREVRLKRGQSRFENRRALELWGGASGVDRLTYRWRTVSRIVGEIVDALRGEAAGA